MVFEDLRIQHPLSCDIKNIFVAESNNSRSLGERSRFSSHIWGVPPYQLLLERHTKICSKRGDGPYLFIASISSIGRKQRWPINNNCFSRAEVETLAKATARQTSANGGACHQHSFFTLTAADTGFWVLIEPMVLAKLKPSLWAAEHSSWALTNAALVLD